MAIDQAPRTRDAQRRRTRQAIVDATARLLRIDPAPTVDAVAAAAAGDVAGGAQGGEDLLDELARQLLLLAEFADVEAAARRGAGQGHHGLEGVTGAL